LNKISVLDWKEMRSLLAQAHAIANQFHLDGAGHHGCAPTVTAGRHALLTTNETSFTTRAPSGRQLRALSVSAEDVCVAGGGGGGKVATLNRSSRRTRG
jgi:hypothetical protein